MPLIEKASGRHQRIEAILAASPDHNASAQLGECLSGSVSNSTACASATVPNNFDDIC